MSQSWFKMRGAARDGKRIGQIAIYGDIGAFGVTANDFRNALEGLGDVDELHINITSDGGDISTGYAIFNMLSRHLSKKIITVDALAASMASVIFMAGDERVMPKNSMLMIHNPWGGIIGSSDEIISFGKALSDMRANMIETYMDATGLPRKEIVAMMDAETWLTARKAKQMGFATRVVEPREINAHARALKLDRFHNVPEQFGRQLMKGAKMTNKATKQNAAADDNDEFESPKSEKEIRAEILAKQKEIRSLCKIAGVPEMADKFIEEDKEVSEVLAALEEVKAKAENPGTKKKSNGAGETEITTRRPGKESNVPDLDVDAIYARFNGRQAAAAA